LACLVTAPTASLIPAAVGLRQRPPNLPRHRSNTRHLSSVLLSHSAALTAINSRRATMTTVDAPRGIAGAAKDNKDKKAVARRPDDQYCPITEALDRLGDRWTLLILRELLGGARRYTDLREALPGIATNLLASRLRQLVTHGLTERVDVPPPVARTWYRLSEQGWRMVPPVLCALAVAGMDHPGPVTQQITPLSGFLAVLLGFNGRLAQSADEDYRTVVDGHTFDIGVSRGQLTAARGEPVAELRGTARDLLEYRRALLTGAGNDLASSLQIDGGTRARVRFMAIFGLEPQTPWPRKGSSRIRRTSDRRAGPVAIGPLPLILTELPSVTRRCR
jgi:DNA-binding HxlR family transcriptional regulator